MQGHLSCEIDNLWKELQAMARVMGEYAGKIDHHLNEHISKPDLPLATHRCILGAGGYHVWKKGEDTCECGQHTITGDSDPITCCGEWTWDGVSQHGEHIWVHVGGLRMAVNRHVAHLVCRKCHRALLEDGKMTGPLVEWDACFNSEHVWLSESDEAEHEALHLEGTWNKQQ